jgi:hypothetical protein
MAYPGYPDFRVANPEVKADHEPNRVVLNNP